MNKEGIRYYKFFVLIIVLLFGVCGCGVPRYQGALSDHFNGKVFFNPEKKKDRDLSYDLYNMKVFLLQNQWPIPGTYPGTADRTPSCPVKATFINHSSILLTSSKANVLFDPVFSYRVSPIPVGPARRYRPGMDFSSLPSIDVVLISHNHYDHMDMPTLKRLYKRFHPVFVVPLGNGILLKRHKIDRVFELDWWQTRKFNGISVTMLPAHHNSLRGLWDYNWALWASYGITVEGKKIYFAGDTAWSSHFKHIHNRWGSPDLAFLPIGSYKPYALQKDYHITPQEAVQAHLVLGAKQSMGMHWGTFILSEVRLPEPPEELRKARSRFGLSKEQFYAYPSGYGVCLRNSG